MPPNGIWPFDDYDSVSRFGDLMHELMDSRYGGVAFLGAGASVPADFPTWAKFHEMFLEHFDAKPASLGDSVATTMRNAFDYHVNREDSKALAFIQSVFGGPVLLVPPVVKLVLRTGSLRYLFTTNFDEILFTAAAGAPVAVYPDYAPMEARFVYLHGRASSAESVNRDLVLGDTGYRLAYRDLPGSPAKTKLQGLASYPVVFVGFSMTDPEVMGTLREMADAARRLQDDHGESILPLNWFAMLKAPSASDPGGAERKRNTERVLQYAGVEAIWYQDGGSGDRHRALLDAAQRMQRESKGRTVAGDEPGFVDALQEAEALAAVTSPTSSDVRRAQAVLEGHPRIARAFMGQVDGMEWFRHLRDARALEPKPSVRMANGARSVPYWLATDFLQRIASVAPAEVKDFLLTVDTDNWVAIGAAFDVLEALDEPAATELAETFARWTVSALADDSFTLARLTQAVRALESSAKQGAAFALARATLVELADSNPSVPEWSTTGFGQAVTLILAKSADGITVAIDALDAVLEQEYVAPDQDKGRYVRNTIEPHRTSLPEHSVLDLAIDVARDTLLAAEDGASRAGAVARLLRSPWPTQRRIGIAHCFLRRPDLPQHETAIITRENLANPHLFHELAKLLADDTSDLSEGSVRALKDFAAALHGGPSETDRYDYASWARIMPDDWLPEPFPAGDDDEDDPDRRLFRDVYFSGVFSPTAPLDQAGFAERAAELTSGDLLDLVRDPATAGVRVTWRHDPGAMWTLLAEYAKGRDELEPLLGIGPGDLRRDSGSSWPVVEALADIAGDSRERWADVLDWAVRMMSEAPSDEFWFLGLLLEKGGRIAPLAVSEGIISLAMRVIEQAKRTAAVEPELIDASMRGGFLNHPVGRATQSLFELFRREMAEQEAAADGEAEIPEWFRMTVLESLERTPMHLGIDAWIGLGRYYPLLCDRSPDAVAFVAPRLESDRPDLSITSIAFWSGYLWAPSVSSDALTRLRDAYRLHASALQKEAVLEADLRDVFCQHIVIGVLREIPGFGDILYDTLGDDFDPVSRGAIASALGRGIAEAAENPETLSHSLATEQFREYWAAHVEQIGGRDGRELAAYLGWLPEAQLPPKAIAHLIEASLDQAEGGSGARLVFEYLSRYVEEDPAEVLRLLSACVESWRLHGYFWLEGEEVHDVLERLIPEPSDEAVFREVVDALAEFGAVSAADARRYRASRPSGEMDDAQSDEAAPKTHSEGRFSSER